MLEYDFVTRGAVPQWIEGIIPIGRNPDGDILVVCSTGVHRWDPELGLGIAESPSLSAYLEKYRCDVCPDL